MRSYYAHLETTTQNRGGVIEPRPVFRSSAIFPAIHFNSMSSRLLFMGYWLLKRNISQISAIITLRSEEGKILCRHNKVITEPKAFRIELKDLLQEIGISEDDAFFGSLEIEFFSTENLVFPFPAAVINYFGPGFSSVVHTAQRIYNDFEDMQNNSQTAVKESGFNIHADQGKEPFIALINGSILVKESEVNFTFYNHSHKTLNYTKKLGEIKPYQAFLIYPARDVNLKEFLEGEVGSCKVDFNVAGIFPRLLVGNFSQNPPAVVITHTYYDCSKASKDSDYWRFKDPDWYQESLALPLLQSGKSYTKIYFYPIYSPSKFLIDLEIYEASGKLLGRLENYLEIDSPAEHFFCISFDEVFEKLNLSGNGPLGVRLMAHSALGEKLPARIKAALDIGDSQSGLPCNICTNLQPYNPALETKDKSFKWGPILSDKPGSSVWIMNSQPKKRYEKEAQIDLSFYREKDNDVLKRALLLPPQGFTVIEPEKDPELANFLDGQIGWFTAISSNPYTTTYYFSKSASGIVGGDHGF